MSEMVDVVKGEIVLVREEIPNQEFKRMKVACVFETPGRNDERFILEAGPDILWVVKARGNGLCVGNTPVEIKKI